MNVQLNYFINAVFCELLLLYGGQSIHAHVELNMCVSHHKVSTHKAHSAKPTQS